MKKLLVLGTSHTFGACVEIHRLPFEQRWHAILAKELGWELTTLAISGATSEQQMHTVFRYFEAYPDARFDQVIVEGRHLGPHDVAYPKPHGKGDVDISEFDTGTNHKAFLRGWHADHNEHPQDRLLPFSAWNTLPTERKKDDFRTWHAEYTFSPLHFIHNATSNLAMCKYLEDYCDDVYWFSIGKSKWGHHWNDFMKNFVKHYIDEDTWPTTEYTGPQCKCGHAGAEGNVEIAQQVINVMKKRHTDE